MKMLRLTCAPDDSPVLVNPLQIKAVYESFRKNSTIVQYLGLEDGYVEVKENMDAIERMLKGIEI